MKVRPLTKYDKRNTKFKKIDDYVVLILYCYFSDLWSSLEQSKNRIPATIFVKKFWIFTKNADFRKITYVCVFLRTKFHVPSIILTSSTSGE